MHARTLERWRHIHDFTLDSRRAERGTVRVVILTAVMMVLEIGAGQLYGSMALLADGWHMATHVAAFSIALFAYRYAREHAHDPRFSFGTGKVSTLGAYTSAVALAVVALGMALEALLRLFEPHPIRFDEAMAIAVLGLVVNLVCGYLLNRARDDGDATDGHGHHDHNLRAAYLHVLADALTSVLAIVALAAGKFAGAVVLDPLMGLVGAAIIAHWSLDLMRDTSQILLDVSAAAATRADIVRLIEADVDNRVADLHVWRVGSRHYAAEIALVTHHPRPPEHYKRLLATVPGLEHVMVEVNPCHENPCTD